MKKSLTDLLFIAENLADQRLKIEKAVLQQLSKQPVFNLDQTTKKMIHEGLALAERAVNVRNTFEKEVLQLFKKGIQESNSNATPLDSNPEVGQQPVFAGTITVQLRKNNPSIDVPFTIHNHFSYPQSFGIECSDLYNPLTSTMTPHSLIALPTFVRIESLSSVKINIRVSLPENTNSTDYLHGNILIRGVDIKFFRLIASINDDPEAAIVHFSEPE